MTVTGALALAAKGVPVFPCDPGTKQPLTERGFYDASTDPAQIQNWWAWRGDALVGVPTGRASGLCVFDVDVDRDKGVDGVAVLRDSTIRPAPTLTHLTPRGGLHLIYAVGPDDFCPTDTSRVGRGLDRRGDGGYVIWWPASGGQVLDAREPERAPDWLLRPVEKRTEFVRRPVTDSDALALMGDWLRDVRDAPHGGRNEALNRAAFQMGQMVEAGLADASTASAWLLEAVQGYPDDSKTKRNAPARIRKSMERGMRDPGFERAAVAAERLFGQPVQWQPRGVLASFDEMTRQPKPIRWLIKGVLPADGVSMLFGEPGAGKSFVAVDWALSVACGRPWFGRKVLTGPVVYILGEGHHGFPGRLSAWTIDRGQKPRAGMFHMTRKGVPFNSPDELGAFVAEVDALGAAPVLVFVDTVQRAMPGQDDSNVADATQLLRAAEALRERWGCAVVLIHHSGHADKTRAKGSIAFKGAMESETAVLKGAGGTIKISCTKMKDGQEWGPDVFAYKEIDLGWTDEDGAPGRSVVLEAAAPVAAAYATKGGWKGPNANDRVFAAALGSVVTDYDKLRDAFMSLHPAEDRKTRAKAFERCYERGLEKGWFQRRAEDGTLRGETDDTDSTDSIEPVLLAMQRDGFNQ